MDGWVHGCVGGEVMMDRWTTKGAGQLSAPAPLQVNRGVSGGSDGPQTTVRGLQPFLSCPFLP